MPYTGKTIDDYVKQFIFDNGKSTSQLYPSDVLVRFNRRMHELEEEIVTYVNNDLYKEGISIDLDDGVAVYPLPSGNSVDDDDPLIPQLKKCLEVSVKFNNNQTKHTKCREYARDNMTQSEEWYATEQNTLNPLFAFDKKSIVIYPTPTADVTDGLIIKYAKSMVDVTLTTQEDELPFARYYINTILVGITVDLVKANSGVDSVAYRNALSDRIRSKADALSKLSDRYITATEHKNPPLTHLMR